MFGRRGRARESAVADGPAAPADEAGNAGYEDTAAERTRTGRPVGRRRVGRGRAAGAAAAGAVGAGFLGLARLVMLAAGLIALLIVAAILLRDLDANSQNSIVKAVHDGAKFFASPFNNVFSEPGDAKKAISINWGIAAAVFLIVGWVVSGLIRRIGRGGMLASGRTAAA